MDEADASLEGLEQLTNFILPPLPLHRRERASCRNQRLSFRPCKYIPRLCFVQAGGVAQGKDHGSLNMLRHLFYDLFGECLRFCRRADEDMWFHFFNYCEKDTMIFALPLIVATCEWSLAFSEFVAVRSEQKAWFINAPGEPRSATFG